MKWISVKDRLPKGNWGFNNYSLSEDVLVANSCAIEIACYDRDRQTWLVGEPANGKWIDKITHWMPLPKNPHKGGKDENT